MPAENPIPATNDALTAPKVLVVEDDACASFLYRNLLQKEGYTVERCADGEAALQQLSKTRFDAVVLDLMMPKVDGIQVLKGMRALPENLLTPAIIITAARLKVVEEEAVRYGVKLFLDKTEYQKLLAGLREIMADRSVHKGARLQMAPPSPISNREALRNQGNAPAPSTASPKETTSGLGLARFFRINKASE